MELWRWLTNNPAVTWGTFIIITLIIILALQKKLKSKYIYIWILTILLGLWAQFDFSYTYENINSIVGIIGLIILIWWIIYYNRVKD